MTRATSWELLATAAMMVIFAGCASTRNHAPVEERRPVEQAEPAAATPTPVEAPPAEAAKPPPPGFENAGKPGYYTVKPGDTLIRVGLDTGQNWRDLVRWNNLDNPNVIEVGQVLRVVPPSADPSQAAARPVVAAKVETRPLDPSRATPGATTAAGPAAVAGPAAASAASAAPAVAATPAAREADDDMNWAWPAAGPIVEPFEDGRHKGISIGGKPGDPVLASADGRVVYAGSSLRGYGNLIIIKHNATYLTAYAHNQTLLVKEDQAVRRGQKIAEMGSTDADRVQLHFEIRRQGKPIDPARLLPAR